MRVWWLKLFGLTVLFLAVGAAWQPATSAQSALIEQQRALLRLLGRGDFAQAVLASQRLIEQFPEFDPAYRHLLRAALSNKELDQAAAYLNTLLARTPPNPQAYYGLGLIYREQQKPELAITNFRKCLTELPEHVPALERLIAEQRALKQEAEAESDLKARLAMRPESAATQYGWGYFLYQNRQYEAALQAFERAIALNPQLTIAQYYQALAHYNLGQYLEAVAAIEKYLQLLDTVPDEEQRLPATLFLGTIHTRLANFPAALSAFETALIQARDLGSKRLEMSALSQLENMYARQDEYAKALPYAQQQLVLARSLDDTANLGRVIGNICNLHHQLGDLATAQEHYLQAVELLGKANDQRLLAAYLTDLADLYVLLRDFGKAANLYEQVLQMARQSNNRLRQSIALESMTALYRQLGQDRKAMETIQQAVALAQKANDPLVEGKTLNTLGALRLRLGELPAATQAYQQALVIGESKNSPQITWNAETGLGWVAERFGKLDEARAHYRKAIEVIERVRAQLGGEEEKAGFFQDKNEAYKQLIALLLASPRSTAASTIASRDEAEAFHYAERARARAFLDLLAEAKVNLEQSLDPDLLERQQALQKQIAQLNAQLFKERALELAKQDKAKIAELEKGLGRAETDESEWRREVRRRNPRYAALKYPEPVTLAETQQLLDDQTVLLAYSLGEAESFLFAVSRRELLVTRLPAAARIGQHVEKLLAALTDKNQPSTDEYRRQADALSQQLIQPARRMLVGKRALIIVPDGALHRLPFEVLFTSAAAAQGDLRRLPYLIKGFAISYAPSASVLAGLRNETRTAAPKAFVAYADPAYEQNAETVIASTVRAASASGRLSLNRLPHSRREAEGIAKLFGSGAADLFLGAAASEENVKLKDRLSQYRLVHFSTHGYVNEVRPRFSGLVLSLPSAEKAAQSEDGLLSAYEIFNLKLNAELVVLSACETGLGKEVKGEGLMSLMRAFMYAGTPSVLVSLWKVDDESAADLMIRFYRYYQQGVKQGKTTVKLNKAEALRRAQLDALAQGNFPYYWAPFVLVGKP